VNLVRTPEELLFGVTFGPVTVNSGQFVGQRWRYDSRLLVTHRHTDRLYLDAELFRWLGDTGGLGGSHDTAGTVRLPEQLVSEVVAGVIAAVEQHPSVPCGEVT